VILLLEGDGTSYIGPIFFGSWIAAIVLFVFVVIPRMDRQRIREHIDNHGGKVIEILIDWFAASGRSARTYEVTYLTHNGERITAKCITSMTSDVQWISDRPPGSDRATPEVAEESGRSEAIDCIECGAKIPAEKTRCPHCGWSYRGN
jgi:hypothetical protein